MNEETLISNITVLAGRPATGKTNFALRLSESYLRQKRRVIFYHAEGPLHLHESDFEFMGAEDVNFLEYLPNIFTSFEDLRRSLTALGPKSESLLVIDTVDLFDFDSADLVMELRAAVHTCNTKVLLVTQIPITYENKPADCAEKYVREKLDLKPEDATIVLGDFPLE